MRVKDKILDRILGGADLPCFSVRFWDGEERQWGRGVPEFRLNLKDPKILRDLTVAPIDNFLEAYVDGSISVDGDFLACLRAGFELSSRKPRSLSRRLSDWLFRLARRNSLRGSRRNISHHYDLGNEFYRLWLDQNLLYTCAYYSDPELSLDEAQVAKMDLVCRKLMLQPEEELVEAGCGWGGFALFAARRYGVRVKAFNISREQICFARDWVKKESLEDRVEFIQDDYRNISGKCDVFVSIGMLEHVGPDHYRDLGQVIGRTLKNEGRGLLHFIGRTRPAPLNPWIARHIFPGAHPPSLTEVLPLFEQNNFSVHDVENLRLHYARTLEDWLRGFEGHCQEIARDKGEAFCRMWRLYLAGSMLSFLLGYLELYQIVFYNGHSNQLSLTRAHLYTDEPDVEETWMSLTPL